MWTGSFKIGDRVRYFRNTKAVKSPRGVFSGKVIGLSKTGLTYDVEYWVPGGFRTATCVAEECLEKAKGQCQRESSS